VDPFAGSGEPDKLALRFVSITRNAPIEDVLSPVIKRIANKVDYERTSKTDDMKGRLRMGATGSK